MQATTYRLLTNEELRQQALRKVLSYSDMRAILNEFAVRGGGALMSPNTVQLKQWEAREIHAGNIPALQKYD